MPEPGAPASCQDATSGSKGHNYLKYPLFCRFADANSLE